MTWLYIIIGVVFVVLQILFIRHQRSLSLRAHLMQEAMRNHDFSFRLSTKGLLPGERAMQEALNILGETIRQQVNQSEVDSWERLTRVLTHEMMNATAPITSISQSLLNHADVKGTSIEDGIRAIHDTSQHMSQFVANYRKMTELEKPIMAEVNLRTILDDISKAYPQLTWHFSISSDTEVYADEGMLRQVLMNLTKNAIEAGAHNMTIEISADETSNSRGNQIDLYIGNDGLPIPAEARQSIFIPFFTTKRSGSGIGLALSRRMMVQQGGMLDLATRNHPMCHVAFILTLQCTPSPSLS